MTNRPSRDVEVAGYFHATPHAIGFLIGGAVVAATGIVPRLWQRDAHE